MVQLTKIDWNYSVGEREQYILTHKHFHEMQGVLLQTCNRVEWYRGSGEIPDAVSRHLFRVVSGLESVLIGESSVVKQVKQAYSDAAQNHYLDKSLHKLFQTALFVGKRVRKETGISKGAMSHSQAVVQFIEKEIGDLKKMKIALIGVNALNEKIIKFLINKHAEPVFVGNRTFNKAAQLAEKYGAKAFRFNNLSNILEQADVVISATAAPHFILKREDLKTNRQLHILDLAVPRDIDPAIGDFENVNLFDIGTIENQIRRNLSIRKEKIEMAEEIIESEVRIFSKNFIYETI